MSKRSDEPVGLPVQKEQELPTKLREKASLLSGWGSTDSTTYLLMDAAEEIERLREGLIRAASQLPEDPERALNTLMGALGYNLDLEPLTEDEKLVAKHVGDFLPEPVDDLDKEQEG